MKSMLELRRKGPLDGHLRLRGMIKGLTRCRTPDGLASTASASMQGKGCGVELTIDRFRCVVSIRGFITTPSQLARPAGKFHPASRVTAHPSPTLHPADPCAPRQSLAVPQTPRFSPARQAGRHRTLDLRNEGQSMASKQPERTAVGDRFLYLNIEGLETCPPAVPHAVTERESFAFRR